MDLVFAAWLSWLIVTHVLQDGQAAVTDWWRGDDTATTALRERRAQAYTERLQRLRNRNARDELATQGYPTIQQALARRIAEHQRTPREDRGPLGGWWWDLLDDSCTRATDARRRRRERADAGELPYQRLIARLWRPQKASTGTDTSGGTDDSATPPPSSTPPPAEDGGPKATGHHRPPPVHATAERLDTPGQPPEVLELEPPWPQWETHGPGPDGVIVGPPAPQHHTRWPLDPGFEYVDSTGEPIEWPGSPEPVLLNQTAGQPEDPPTGETIMTQLTPTAIHPPDLPAGKINAVQADNAMTEIETYYRRLQAAMEDFRRRCLRSQVGGIGLTYVQDMADLAQQAAGVAARAKGTFAAHAEEAARMRRRQSELGMGDGDYIGVNNPR